MDTSQCAITPKNIFLLIFVLRILENLPACSTTLFSDITEWRPNVALDIDRGINTATLPL